jgi:stage II sporulation protein D
MANAPTKAVRLRALTRLCLRLATGLGVLVLVWSCASVPGLREESTSSYIRVPFVRVLLQESGDNARLGSDDAFAIECLKGGAQNVYYSGQPVRVEVNNRLLNVYDQNGNVIEESLDEVNIIPRGHDNRLHLNDKRYRGIMEILPRGEVLRLVNIVYMEDYLKGVVPPEIGPREKNEIEAVKAQAVAARTYAMAHLGQYGYEPYDMKSSIIDQVYEGVDVEYDLVNQAVNSTAGTVVTYEDQFITAYYHSTSGGATDNIEDVWDKAEVPYLKSVDDGTAGSWSKYWVWQERFTEAQLRGRLEQYLASDRGRDLRIGKIRDIIIRARTPGGRVSKLTVITDLDSYNFYKDRIRWAIGRTSNPELILPSTHFDIKIDRDANGDIQSIVFKGHGYGHGVGMCQTGAIGHARKGWTFDRILKHYYTGVEIKKLY